MLRKIIIFLLFVYFEISEAQDYSNANSNYQGNGVQGNQQGNQMMNNNGNYNANPSNGASQQSLNQPQENRYQQNIPDTNPNPNKADQFRELFKLRQQADLIGPVKTPVKPPPVNPDHIGGKLIGWSDPSRFNESSSSSSSSESSEIRVINGSENFWRSHALKRNYGTVYIINGPYIDRRVMRPGAKRFWPRRRNRNRTRNRHNKKVANYNNLNSRLVGPPTSVNNNQYSGGMTSESRWPGVSNPSISQNAPGNSYNNQNMNHAVEATNLQNAASNSFNNRDMNQPGYLQNAASNSYNNRDIMNQADNSQNAVGNSYNNRNGNQPNNWPRLQGRTFDASPIKTEASTTAATSKLDQVETNNNNKNNNMMNSEAGSQNFDKNNDKPSQTGQNWVKKDQSETNRGQNLNDNKSVAEQETKDIEFETKKMVDAAEMKSMSKDGQQTQFVN